MNYSTFYLTFSCPGDKEKDKPDNDISLVYIPLSWVSRFLWFYLFHIRWMAPLFNSVRTFNKFSFPPA